MNQTLEDPIPKTNTERNRPKKPNINRRCRRKAQQQPKTILIDKKPATKRQWTWKIKNSKHITLQHKRTLLSIHRLSNIKEQNLANIHNLQTLLLITIFKNKHSVITSTTTSYGNTAKNTQKNNQSKLLSWIYPTKAHQRPTHPGKILQQPNQVETLPST